MAATADSPAKKIFNNKKTLATVFWDQKCVLFVEFLQPGTTINTEGYCETLQRLRRAIQNKRRGVLTSGVVHSYDNGRPHNAGVMKSLLDGFQWDIFDHPAYSPNLASSDYHLFPELKTRLGVQGFRTGEELQDAVNTHLKALAATFNEEGIGKLVHRYGKCLNLNGDYVKK